MSGPTRPDPPPGRPWSVVETPKETEDSPAPATTSTANTTPAAAPRTLASERLLAPAREAAALPPRSTESAGTSRKSQYPGGTKPNRAAPGCPVAAPNGLTDIDLGYFQ